MAKPRVLLSILKYAYFDNVDEGETLFTAISAGYGRFECDRLLKPSGVELMNLAHSATIEISVLRRDPATDQKQPLRHCLVPLSGITAMRPGFFSTRPENAESQIWDGWLGLFGADVSLMDQPPQHVFQSSLDMGNSATKFPRLFVRIQYLDAGISAVNLKRNVSRQDSRVENDTYMHAETSTDAPDGSVERSPRSSTREPIKHAGSVGMTWMQQHPQSMLRAYSTSSQQMATHHDVQRGLSYQLDQNARPLLQQVNSQGTATMQSLVHSTLVPEEDTSQSGWRQRHDDFMREHGSVLPLRKLSGQEPEDSHSVSRNETVDPRLIPAHADITRQIAELQRQNKELERENLRLHEVSFARESIEREFFEQVAPVLEKAGRPSLIPPIRAAGTTESIRLQLAEVVAALNDVTSTRATTASISGSSEITEVQEKINSNVMLQGPGPSTSFIEEALGKALDGGEAAFEDWFNHAVDAEARARLTRAEGILALCRRVASLRTGNTPPTLPSALPRGPLHFYTPVLTDPVDCLFAAQLLRTGAEPPTIEIKRIEPGVYQLGHTGPKVNCYINGDRLMAQSMEFDGVTKIDGTGKLINAEAMELRTFLDHRAKFAWHQCGPEQ